MGYKLVSAIITLGILIILILTGPAQAFLLGLTILNPEVEKGETVSFTASVEIEQTDVLDITSLILKLQGPTNINCEFLPDGTIISGCSGISIQQIETANYTYGYGFEQGTLSYNITLDTAVYFAGTYSTFLVMVIEEEMFEKQGEDIIIRTEIMGLEGCSIRAEQGNLIVENQDFGNNNKISFYIPLENAVSGGGFLTAQSGRQRFSYSFDIVEILENNQDYAVILISGKYKIHLGKEKSENAIIFFDKINNKISLAGDNINLEQSVVSVSQKC